MTFFRRALVLCQFPLLLWSQSNPDSVATMVFTGDLNFADKFEQAAASSSIDVFAHWNRIGQYDLMMVNLENAITQSDDSVKKEFVFKMKAEYLSQFKSTGISIVNCANNHTADFGEDGILETIQALDSAEIHHTGIGKNLSDARRPVILSINGMQFGFLGYGGVRAFIASKTHPGTTTRSSALILEDIKNLKAQVDYIIVNLHWGDELELKPDSNQITLAHRMIRAGADLIIGHHPHVLQGIEQYRKKVIAYSLGNFVFGGNSRSANCETAVLKVRFSQTSMEVETVPVVVRNWQPTRAEGNASKRIMNRIQERSKLFLETIPWKPLGAQYE